MRYIPILLSSVFGFFGTIFLGLLGANGFTRNQRKKFPFLKKLDGKQLHLLASSILCFAVAFFAGGWKEVLNMPSPIEVNQKPNEALVRNNEITNENSFTIDNNNSSRLSDATPGNIQTSLTNQAKIFSKKDSPSKNSKSEKNTSNYSPLQSLTKARSLYGQGKYSDAIQECDKILSVNPKNSEALSLKKMAQNQMKILSQ